MAASDKIVTVLKGNRTAVIVLIIGGSLFALYVADRAGDVVDEAVAAGRDIVRTITGTGVVAAAILIASFLLGAPAWLAYAAMGVFLLTSGAAKLTGAILGRANGTGDGGLSDADLLRELCKSHNGVGAGIIEVGGSKLGICGDETIYHLKG